MMGNYQSGSTPQETCNKVTDYFSLAWSGTYAAVQKGLIRESEYSFWCYFLPKGIAGNYDGALTARRVGLAIADCPTGRIYNKTTGECTFSANKGTPPPLACVQNPINITIGNKFQKIDDIKENGENSIEFSRYYNSLDQIWRHSYSANVKTYNDQYFNVTLADGAEFQYSLQDNVIQPLNGSTGKLEQTSTGWQFTSLSGDIYTFDQSGKITGQRDASGHRHTIQWSSDHALVSDDSGNTLTFTEDVIHQPIAAASSGVTINYKYDNLARLLEVTKLSGSSSSTTTLHYEDIQNNRLLTGITDESGIRFATWQYDSQGRAISSSHAGGADSGTITFGDNDTATLTNEYGKSSVYSFVTVNGARRISSINGTATPNCPSSNSTFTYNAQGLLKTKTDAKGNLTTYDYNDRGLETSRTEASGTLQARTVTTEWHPSLYLKTKVTEPDRITTYQYDAQGRQTGQTVIPR